MKTIISFGEVLVDLIETRRGKAPSVFAGGAPANVAVCYSKLGGKSYFVGGIGDDSHAAFLQQQLKESAVDISYSKIFPNSMTARALVHLDEKNERTFQILRDNTADTLFNSTDLKITPFLKSLLFHFCSNTLTSESLYRTTLDALSMAHSTSTLVCFDVNLRLELWSDICQIEQRVFKCFSGCHIVKMSREELDFLANTRDLDNKEYIEEILSLGVLLVLVTDGPKSISGFTSTFHLTVCPPGIKALDTTAAGDAFIAGFLYSISRTIKSTGDFKVLLSSKECLDTSLKFAANCGAVACLKKGAFNSLPTLLDLDELVIQNN